MAIHSRMQELHHLAIAAIESNQVTAVRQTFRTIWEKLIHLMNEAKASFPRAVNPVVLYDEFMLMLGNECMSIDTNNFCVVPFESVS